MINVLLAVQFRLSRFAFVFVLLIFRTAGM
jgi:hypothetical protein